MDRTAAARTLGVAPDAPAGEIERAFRRQAREGHPDRFPPGSEAAEDATYRIRELVEARRTLLAVPDVPAQPGRDPQTEASWAWAGDAPRPAHDERFPSPTSIDRRMRSWGLAWGSFLLLSAIICAFVGATQTSNDALPLWSPALAVGGIAALTIGVRAALRLRAAGPRR